MKHGERNLPNSSAMILSEPLVLLILPLLLTRTFCAVDSPFQKEVGFLLNTRSDFTQQGVAALWALVDLKGLL